MPVPEGGIGRVLIYKTYKDPRTYMMNGDDIVWVRSLSGYRLGGDSPAGILLPVLECRRPVDHARGRQAETDVRQSERQSSPVTVHARRTTANFAALRTADMFFDDIKTLYDLGAPETHGIRVDQSYSDYRKGRKARLDLAYLPLQDLKVIDLDTAKAFQPAKDGSVMSIQLEVPITDDRQSVHLRITGTLADPAYKVEGGNLVFDRTVHGLRNTILLPAGWEVAGVSQSGTIGRSQGRAFVSLINLNSENQYRVVIRARKGSESSR